MSQDSTMVELRDQISELDRQILEAVNARLELVARLRRHKEENGIAFLDPGREEWLLQHLADANAGPLTEEGVRELFSEILDLVKRELARDEVRAT
jgi:chorismate mutase